MKYDAETKNGILYISGLYWAKFEYRTVVDDLDDLYPTKHTMLTEGTAKSYSIGSRSLSRTTLSGKQVLELWEKLMAEKLRLEQGSPKSPPLAMKVRTCVC